MVERIAREGDRNIYQPKIHAERISELYAIIKQSVVEIHNAYVI